MQNDPVPLTCAQCGAHFWARTSQAMLARQGRSVFCRPDCKRLMRNERQRHACHADPAFQARQQAAAA